MKGKRITKPNGMKPEDCAVFAQAAGKFACGVYLIKNGKKVNAKSIMGLISLNIKKEDYIYLDTKGEDEQAALEELYPIL